MIARRNDDVFIGGVDTAELESHRALNAARMSGFDVGDVFKEVKGRVKGEIQHQKNRALKALRGKPKSSLPQGTAAPGETLPASRPASAYLVPAAAGLAALALLYALTRKKSKTRKKGR